MRSRLIVIAVPVLAVAAIAGGLVAVVVHGRGDPLRNVATSKDIPFQRIGWLRHPDSPTDFTRGEMSKDLVDRVLRHGMPARAVRHLLGPPDFGGRREYGYFVGEAAHYSGGFVTIRFDPSLRLRSARRVASGGGF